MDDIFTVNFNEIDLKERIGFGSFGVVHKANWTPPGEKCSRIIAVKIIDNPSEKSTKEKKKLEDNVLGEVQFLQKFVHENIVTLYGVSKDTDCNICLLFEYADCGSLYNFLHYSDNEVSFNGKIDWMLQCAKGMEYLHRNKVAHRDLKTHNLLLLNNYSVLKICDFGTVKKLVTMNTEFIGTVCYMAPELCNEKGMYNYKCDVFSFGIIFWEVMSREKPFHEIMELPVLTIQKKIVDGKRPDISKMMNHEESDCIKPIIEKCWDGNPESRPTMKDLCDLLPFYPLGYSNIDVNEFEMGNFIGARSYGFVHKGYWEADGQIKEVAMKIIERFYEDKEITFLKDIRNVQKLNHDNIVILYGVSKMISHIYLIFEFSDCGSLYDCIHGRDHKISYNDKLDWMLQCALGLEYLHSKGIVLLGLKTEKLFLFDDRRRLKILYSGPVKEFAVSNSKYDGTGSYMAPEICNATGEYTDKCDVFSFGIIFWEVMARQEPFYEYKENGNLNKLEVQHKIAKGVRPDINYLRDYKGADQIQPIIEKCWDQDPCNRPTMKELCDRLPIYSRVSSKINYYEIKLGTFIGNGSFGLVYKGVLNIERNEQQDIAVKIIQDSEEEKLIRNEIHNLTLIGHDCIVTLYGFAIDPKYRICIVSEYADCGSLYTFLHRTDKEVLFFVQLTWMQQCAEGLEYLHSKQIIHRDLKTQNLLLYNNFRTLKICDFGKVKKFAIVNTEFKGTNCCRAPETYEKGKYTEKSDAFSCGIIFWEIMSRKIPFDDLQNVQSNQEIKKKIIDGDRPDINVLKPHEDNDLIIPTIKRCWDQNPENRPTMKEVCVLLQIYSPVDFNDLQLETRIEDGGFGNFYKAIWKINDQQRDVMLNEIQGKTSNADKLPRSLEMRALKKGYDLKQLNHPNVAIFYGIAKGPFNSIYSLTEYSKYGHLYNFLHSTTNDVSYADKLNWMLQCAEGVLYLHSKNITLWALRPNCLWLFDQYRTLKIREYGVSINNLINRNKEGIFDGFLAPEIYDAQGKRNSEKMQVFSFGIILWAVMSRKEPFYEYKSESQNIKEKVIAGTRPDLNDIQNNDDAYLLKPIIEKCWSQTVENRPAMKELSSFLKLILTKKPKN